MIKEDSYTVPPTVDEGQIARGFITYEDGTEYEGIMLDAVPHGRGILKNADGHRYSGTFFYGKPQGYGTWTLPDGTVAYGKWVLGQFKIMNKQRNFE